MGTKPPVITVNRSAKSGQFVTPATVKRSPSTTVTEHYKQPITPSKK